MPVKKVYINFPMLSCFIGMDIYPFFNLQPRPKEIAQPFLLSLRDTLTRGYTAGPCLPESQTQKPYLCQSPAVFSITDFLLVSGSVYSDSSPTKYSKLNCPVSTEQGKSSPHSVKRKWAILFFQRAQTQLPDG